jgi:hypothetical protein
VDSNARNSDLSAPAASSHRELPCPSAMATLWIAIVLVASLWPLVQHLLNRHSG